MKKTLLAVLAALMVLCCFVGCGGKTLGGSYWVPEAYAECATWDEYMTETIGAGQPLGIYFRKDGKAEFAACEWPYKESAANTAVLKDWLTGLLNVYKFENGVLTALDGSETMTFAKAPFIPPTK